MNLFLMSTDFMEADNDKDLCKAGTALVEFAEDEK